MQFYAMAIVCTKLCKRHSNMLWKCEAEIQHHSLQLSICQKLKIEDIKIKKFSINKIQGLVDLCWIKILKILKK